MKITHIGHAVSLVETNGISLLSDPWWRGPCFGAQWWVYPKPFLEAVERAPIDYIYISHGHHDHFHAGTLRSLPKTSVVLVAAALRLGDMIREVGFDVIEFTGDDEIAIGPEKNVRCRIIQTHGDDSLLVIDDGERVCININDALHSAPHDVQDHYVTMLRRLYPHIDYVLCGYGTASHFPNCYVIPGKDNEATARRRQQYFNREWARVVHALNPRYAFPFAADVVLLEDALFWTNAAIHNGERPGAALLADHPDTTIRTFDIAPGFVIDGDDVMRAVVRASLDEAMLREELADGIRRANLATAVTTEGIDEVGRILGERVDRMQDDLARFPVNYRMLIRFHNSARQLTLIKRAGRVALGSVDSADESDYDLVYRTRFAYLKWALHERVGDEILFVGSGGVFEYRSRALVASNAHREFIGLIRDQVADRQATGRPRSLLRAAKRLVNRAIRRPHIDLYDLNEWTVYRK